MSSGEDLTTKSTTAERMAIIDKLAERNFIAISKCNDGDGSMIRVTARGRGVVRGLVVVK